MTSPRYQLDATGSTWREVEGEIVILAQDHTVYLTVNDSAALLWPALEQGATEDELVDRLRAEYPAAPESLQSDVRAFLQALREKSLLRILPD